MAHGSTRGINPDELDGQAKKDQKEYLKKLQKKSNPPPPPPKPRKKPKKKINKRGGGMIKRNKIPSYKKGGKV
jgi:hypothetical protein|tara:strand:+ start:517 stop:735 length:219 start_codon:yes stop_codon:yes gene_type:complete